jgi:hypothetical protein
MKKILMTLIIGVFCFGQTTVKVPENEGIEIFNEFSTKILKDFKDMRLEIEKLKVELDALQAISKKQETVESTIQIDPVILEYIKGKQ